LMSVMFSHPKERHWFLMFAIVDCLFCVRFHFFVNPMSAASSIVHKANVSKCTQCLS
jgi:hypothetical protein